MPITINDVRLSAVSSAILLSFSLNLFPVPVWRICSATVDLKQPSGSEGPPWPAWQCSWVWDGDLAGSSRILVYLALKIQKMNSNPCFIWLLWKVEWETAVDLPSDQRHWRAPLSTLLYSRPHRSVNKKRNKSFNIKLWCEWKLLIAQPSQAVQTKDLVDSFQRLRWSGGKL